MTIFISYRQIPYLCSYLTAQVSPGSEGYRPVWAHWQCLGKQRFQCDLYRHLHGDQGCSPVYLHIRKDGNRKRQSLSIDMQGGRIQNYLLIANLRLNYFSSCTFGVIEMDGFEIVEPHFLVKRIEHGPHASFCSQVISYQDKISTKKKTKTKKNKNKTQASLLTVSYFKRLHRLLLQIKSSLVLSLDIKQILDLYREEWADFN